MGAGFLQRKSTRYGVPFLMMIVGGSFGLKEFAQLRYDFRPQKTISKEDAEKLGITMKDRKEVTLETEYEKIAKIDTGNWENVRGPRPWEEGNKMYEEAQERAKKTER
ncbi:Cytochrome c oxidase assembly protein COX16, mitochondrial [Chionoecetes opilio]|uniref:Cytochrome c oxidase assembly protein COX16 homolog, mitochondrial n=1 Tax=Chionoecetes opilio TaxID=41210 RepID=A0A8J5BZH5_CHIOP|nr:Cytochrome c oxidase assembly protein COX16, mitochondrial [Chionoecetes opilio]